MDKPASDLLKAVQTKCMAINLTESVSIKCYPNPFTDQLAIEIAGSDIQEMDVKNFDISGQLIRYLYHGNGIERRIMI